MYVLSLPLTHADDKCEVLSLAELMRCLLTSMNPITKFGPSELLAMPPGFLLFSPDKVHVLNMHYLVLKSPFLQAWFVFQFLYMYNNITFNNIFCVPSLHLAAVWMKLMYHQRRYV